MSKRNRTGAFAGSLASLRCAGGFSRQGWAWAWHPHPPTPVRIGESTQSKKSIGATPSLSTAPARHIVCNLEGSRCPLSTLFWYCVRPRSPSSSSPILFSVFAAHFRHSLLLHRRRQKRKERKRLCHPTFFSYVHAYKAYHKHVARTKVHEENEKKKKKYPTR